MVFVLTMIVLSIVWDYFRGRIKGLLGMLMIGGIHAALNIGGYYLLNNGFGCDGTMTQVLVTGFVVYSILTPLCVAIIYRIKYGMWN